MLYIFYGEDSFSIREAFGELKKTLNADGALDTNTVTFSAAGVSPEEVIAACDTVPFLGERRLVVVEGTLRRSGRGGGRRGKKAETDGEGEASGGPWDALADYIGRMPETTVLVLIDGEAKDQALLRRLRTKGEARGFQLPAQKAVAGWVQSYAGEKGIQLDAGAAKALADLAGNDTWALANELAKLRDYAGGRAVTADDVRLMVAPRRELPPWDLLDPIVGGKGAQALKTLRTMLSQKEPLVIATMVQRAYRQVAVAREMLDAGASTRDIGERLGVSGFPLDKLVEQASRHSPEMIGAAYERMVQADLDIKTGVYDPDLSLELMVTDLAVASAGRTRAA